MSLIVPMQPSAAPMFSAASESFIASGTIAPAKTTTLLSAPGTVPFAPRSPAATNRAVRILHALGYTPETARAGPAPSQFLKCSIEDYRRFE